MKLFCVRFCWPWEYDDIRAIFATREEAEAYAAIQKEKDRDGYEEITVEEWTLGEEYRR